MEAASGLCAVSYVHYVYVQCNVRLGKFILFIYHYNDTSLGVNLYVCILFGRTHLGYKSWLKV